VDIKALDVKKLREKTGAGMMDCKKALVEAKGDFGQAERILKELGLAAAQKRAGRETKEGRIFSGIGNGRGVLVELSCETDFVATNQEFIALGEKLTAQILADGEAVKQENLEEQVKEAIGRIKENIVLRRYNLLTAGEEDLLVDYIHGQGKIGVLVEMTVSDPALKDHPRVKETAFDLALHTAAFAPLYLSRDKVGEDYCREQEQVFMKQAENLGKPEKVLKGIVQGKLNKHLSEICLLDQAFVKDQSLKVSKVIAELGKEVDGQVAVKNYLYYKTGEVLA
jgi:elongation factor Ts